ncbi:MAG: (2Fe-2S)-binding protein [Candidatus Acidiferrum sp.]|jgi:sarcosine oxidase subunit alpha
MPENVTVYVNDLPVTVPTGATVAVAVMLSSNVCRTSVSGEPRAPLCAMGACFECRVEINEVRHLRSCQVACEPQMKIKVGR